MGTEIPGFLLEPSGPVGGSPPPGTGRARFIEQGLRYLSGFLETTQGQWEATQQQGLLQQLDARVKVLFLLSFAVAVSLKHTPAVPLGINALVFSLAAVSRLALLPFCRRVAFLTFFFGALLSLPASLNLVVPGTVVLPLYHFDAPRQWWIYHLPATVGITREGLQAVALLSSRVAASIGLALLVVHTTPLADLVRGLKALRVPEPFLMVMTLALKFVVVFARTMEDLYLAQKSRTLAANSAEGRIWVAGRMALLFRRTQHRYGEVFKAMQARAFQGDFTLARPGRLSGRDWTAGGLVVAGAGLCWYL